MNYKKIFLIVLCLAVIMSLASFISSTFFPDRPGQVANSIYDFKMKALDGHEVDFEQYKGKNLLIVNTASKCGYTYQYEDLEKLHEQYGDKVTILGFPANNFLWQEPGSNSDIASFCQKNYGVKFQMFEKVSVKGKDSAPIYKWLLAKSGKKPSWNFCKYLIDKTGKITGFYSSKVNPMDQEIIAKISK